MSCKIVAETLEGPSKGAVIQITYADQKSFETAFASEAKNGSGRVLGSYFKVLAVGISAEQSAMYRETYPSWRTVGTVPVSEFSSIPPAPAR